MGHPRKIVLLVVVMATAAWFTVWTGLRNSPQKADLPGDGFPAHVESADAEARRAAQAVVGPVVPTQGSGTTKLRKATLADIKEGTFRSQLEKLPSEIQEQVLAEFTKHPALLNDIDSLRVDGSGMLIYACSFIPLADTNGTQSAAILVADAASLASVPISSPPIRHSREGARNVLFLDFNGHVITGTAWNTLKGVSSWDCRPYDTDGDESTFSATEQSDIIQIWERVSEDYSPFDVDVTTQQPSSWNRYTGHVLITPETDKTGQACPHNGFGGYAYVDVFGQFYYSYNYSGCYSPAWVTEYDTLASIVAEACSHEFGHNLNLHHDGTITAGYYGGHNPSGTISWGPIMGTGYYRNVSQWSKGEYYDANNTTDDDLAEISERLNYRSDDYGDENLYASVLGLDTLGAISQNGVIETTDNPDVFSFYTGAGTLSISASTYRAASSTWGGNLDILMELYNSGGTLLASSNPEQDVNASITLSVPAGNYFLHIKPVGVGSPQTSPPSGFTSYGSLGQYRISGTLSGDTDGDGIPNQWEIDYFGGFTNAVATADSDGDGADNLTEYVAGTLPNNASSVFKATAFSAPLSGGSPFVITWNPVAGRVYNVGWSDGLRYTPFTGISGDLPPTINTYTDTVERTGLQNFYRVEVRMVP